MQQYQINQVAIGRAVVYYVRATQAFSAEIEYPHCISILVVGYPQQAPCLGKKGVSDNPLTVDQCNISIWSL